MTIQDILIITHDRFGESAINAVRMIAGHYGHLHTVGLMEGQDPSQFGLDIEQTLCNFEDPKRVLVLVDFFGGTPANQILQLLSRYPVKAISGFNLPFLLDAYVRLSCNTLEPEFLQTMMQDACQSICDINLLYESFSRQQCSESDF